MSGTAQAAQKLQLRDQFASLAISGAWQEIVLPMLQGEINRLETTILETDNVRGEALNDARAERRALVKFLNGLRGLAAGVMQPPAANATAEEIAMASPLQSAMRERVLAAFSPRRAEADRSVGAPVEQPLPDAPMTAEFDPFAGPIQSGLSQPSPNPPP